MNEEFTKADALAIFAPKHHVHSGSDTPRVNFDDLDNKPNLKKFGGNGADGNLEITSGTTTISAAGARILEKNYRNLSITGTGQLTFSNSHNNGTVVWLKISGDLTLNASAPCLSVAGMGAAGGAAVTLSGNNGTTGAGAGEGVDGTNGAVSVLNTNLGSRGEGGDLVNGAGGAATTTLTYFSSLLDSLVRQKYPFIFCGAGGGSGGQRWEAATNSQGSSGAGGNGGGCLIIEVAGNLNFTTTNGISVAGNNGGNASGASVSAGGVMLAGGGGGGGGFCLLIYNNAIAVTGTINTSAGTGGNNDGAGTAVNGYGGGGGGTVLTAGSSGTTSSTDGAKTGGDGAVGASLVALNTVGI